MQILYPFKLRRIMYMNNLNCSTCGDSTDAREAMTCKSCGSAMCRNCADINGYLCSHCYSDLSYIN